MKVKVQLKLPSVTAQDSETAETFLHLMIVVFDTSKLNPTETAFVFPVVDYRSQ